VHALEKERERRFGAAAEFREALEKAEAEVDGAGARLAAASARLGKHAGALWARRWVAWAALGKLWRALVGWDASRSQGHACCSPACHRRAALGQGGGGSRGRSTDGFCSSATDTCRSALAAARPGQSRRK